MLEEIDRRARALVASSGRSMGGRKPNPPWEDLHALGFYFCVRSSGSFYINSRPPMQVHTIFSSVAPGIGLDSGYPEMVKLLLKRMRAHMILDDLASI